jgi:hypothetical protein
MARLTRSERQTGNEELHGLGVTPRQAVARGNDHSGELSQPVDSGTGIVHPA